MRVLILSHNHPAELPGGAQSAAYALFHALENSGYATKFIGLNSASTGKEKEFVSRNDLILKTHREDRIRFARRGGSHVRLGLPPFPDPRLEKEIVDFDPDIIHFHHLLGFGLLTLVALAHRRRQFGLSFRMLLTCHEYLLICPNNGQLLKSDRALCEGEPPHKCAACVIEAGPKRLVNRQLSVLAALAHLDCLVSPSKFLRKMLRDNGIESPIEVIPNLVELGDFKRKTPSLPNKRHRFGFFGVFGSNKGVDVVLKAAELATDTDRSNFEIQLHGTGLPSIQDDILSKAKELNGFLTYHGRYDPQEAIALMRTVDTVLVPSVWYENAPLVIGEARVAARPVIVSDLGGMREAVTHGKDGFKFEAGNPAALLDAMREIAHPERWKSMAMSSLERAPDDQIALVDHIELYEKLLKNSA